MAERVRVQVGIGLDQDGWRGRIEMGRSHGSLPPLTCGTPTAPPNSNSVSVHGPVGLPAPALKIQGPDWLLDGPKTSEHNRAGSQPPG